MTTLQLQNSLTHKIQSIQDIDFLKALEIIIDSREKRNEVFLLNESQKRSIKKSKEEIQNGKVYSHKEVIKKNSKWLQ